MEFGYISRTGRFYCHRPGRGKTGRYSRCLECKCQIYTRGHRLRKNKNSGRFCKRCFNKLFPPPRPIWLDGKRLRRIKQPWEE